MLLYFKKRPRIPSLQKLHIFCLILAIYWVHVLVQENVFLIAVNKARKVDEVSFYVDVAMKIHNKDS